MTLAAEINFLTVLETAKSKNKVQQDSVPSEGLLPGLQHLAVPSPGIFSSSENVSHVLSFMTSFKLCHYLQALFSNTMKLRVRPSTFEFWGGCNSI
jgi:hypothetical protein